jgi:hypothetical protein
VLAAAVLAAIPVFVGPACAPGPERVAEPAVAVDDPSRSPVDAYDFQVVPAGPGRFIVTAIRRLGGRAATGDAAVRAFSAARAREHGHLASARAWLLLGREAARHHAPDVATAAALNGLRDLGETVQEPPDPALLDRLQTQIKAYRKAHFADFAE